MTEPEGTGLPREEPSFVTGANEAPAGVLAKKGVQGEAKVQNKGQKPPLTTETVNQAPLDITTTFG